MNFKRHRNTLVSVLFAAMFVGAPQLGALAATTPAAVGEQEVLQAYSEAAKQSYQTLQVVKSPAEAALATAKKQAEETENNQIQPALLARNAAIAPVRDQADAARKKAFAAETAAEPAIQKQYDAAISAAAEKKRMAIEQAKALYADKKNEMSETLANALKYIGGESDARSVLAPSIDAMNADLEPVRAKANALIAKAEEEYKRAQYEAETAKNGAKGHLDAVAQAALQPTIDALAVTEAEAGDKLHAALKPFQDAEHAAIAEAQKHYDQTTAQAQAQYDAAFVKRVKIWIEYKSGRISAATAVAQLSDLANQVGR